MAVDVRVETVIARPVAEVAAYAADPSHAPEWYANIRSVEWRTDPVLVEGAEMDFVARSWAAGSPTRTAWPPTVPSDCW